MTTWRALFERASDHAASERDIRDALAARRDEGAGTGRDARRDE